MHYKSYEGNVVIEFLIYLLVVITFLTLLVDFFVIAKSLNEMNMVTNSISVAISKIHEPLLCGVEIPQRMRS